ncbi:hypothetical protein HZS_1604 [Henneguya salminicola]|nr:hypothetical protein HZS_1604 [Henneguya salminicola]
MRCSTKSLKIMNRFPLMRYSFSAKYLWNQSKPDYVEETVPGSEIHPYIEDKKINRTEKVRSDHGHRRVFEPKIVQTFDQPATLEPPPHQPEMHETESISNRQMLRERLLQREQTAFVKQEPESPVTQAVSRMLEKKIVGHRYNILIHWSHPECL